MTALAKDLWVWMDVSATCNLSCRDCYTRSAHEAVLMSPEQFERVLRLFHQPSLVLRKLHLNWRGEPLINKRLPLMLRRKRELLPSVPLEFHTHGLLLTPSLAEEIIDSVKDNDRIYVSIDGGWPDAHEANRGSGTWLGALRGLKALLDARACAGREGPIIGIYEITYERRTRAHPDLIELGRKCDEWTRVNAIGVDGGEAAFITPTRPTGACFWAGHSFCITARGDVHVCLLSFRPEGLLGNIFADEFRLILDRASAFRTRLETLGRSSIAHCRDCRKTEGSLDEVDVVSS